MKDTIKDFGDVAAVGVGSAAVFTEILPVAVAGVTFVWMLLRCVDLGMRIRRQWNTPDDEQRH